MLACANEHLPAMQYLLGVSVVQQYDKFHPDKECTRT